MSARPRDRFIARAMILVGVLLCAFRCATWQGCTSPLRIDGGSMGEQWPGEHRQVECPACHFPHAIDATQSFSLSRLTCPNCRSEIPVGDDDVISPGKAILLDRTGYWFSAPRRLEVIAFRTPDTGELAIKRVAALPGEEWEIRHGDLFVAGRVIRKTPAEFQSLAVCVYDDRFRKSPLESAWTPWGDAWQTTSTGFTWQGRGGESDRAARLVYRHRPYHPAAQSATAPMTDYDAFNPSVARPLHAMRDLAVSGRFSGSAGRVKLEFEFPHGYGNVVWELADDSSSPHHFLCGRWDETLWLIVDGRIVRRDEIRISAADVTDLPEEIVASLRLRGVGEGSLEISQLQVWRDIHFLSPDGQSDSYHPPDSSADDNFAEGYIVLGDNPPLSIDSRHWLRRITRADLCGRVVE